MRGYCGIGIENIKTETNYGTLFRSAYVMGADFIFLIGKRFKRQCSDTVCSYRHLPLFEFKDAEDFINHIPYDCQPIAIEITDDARDIANFIHPERAIYILGAEDGLISKDIIKHCKATVKIPTTHCLNVAVAGSIVLYDRLIKTK